MVHFPAGEQEDLAALWLWSERAGVFSHETALMLHNLSDALPRKVNLTLPSNWKQRRLRVPEGLILHHADVPKGERVQIGSVPVTSVARTLHDCVAVHTSTELIEMAVRQASTRRLIDKNEARAVLSRAKAK